MQAAYSGIGITLGDASQVYGTTGDGTFNSGVTIDSFWNGNVALADLNLDGHLDAVFHELFTGQVLVRLGNGNGTFSATRTYQGTTRGEGVQIGDYNGDGIEDILTIGDSGYAGVLINNGNGTFRAMVSTLVAPAGVSPNVVYQMQVADLNGDAKLDIVSGINNGTSLYVAFGTGGGTFGAYSALPGGSAATRFDIGDVNGDGIMDIAAATYGGSGLDILIGNGNGTFQGRVAYAAQGTPEGVQLTDLNNDGALDVVTLSFSNNTVNVLLGNGNGTFKAQTSFTVGGHSDLFDDDTLVAADLNGDGFQDIVLNHQTSSSVGYLLGNGDGSFKSEISLATTATPEGLAVGDLNEDGGLDIVAAGLKVFTANTHAGILSVDIDLMTISSARSTLSGLTGRINSLSAYAGSVGAYQSRLISAGRSLSTMELGFREAASQIRDVDVAESVANMVRQKILVDAAASVLKQANQSPAIALKLLQDI